MSENLTTKQKRAIAAMIASGSTTQAAAAAGITTDTWYRWMQDADFQAALRSAGTEALETFGRAVGGLADLTMEALRDGLEAGSINVRLRAAGMTLDAILRIRQHVELENRLLALEAMVQQ